MITRFLNCSSGRLSRHFDDLLHFFGKFSDFCGLYVAFHAVTPPFRAARRPDNLDFFIHKLSSVDTKNLIIPVSFCPLHCSGLSIALPDLRGPVLGTVARSTSRIHFKVQTNCMLDCALGTRVVKTSC